MKRTREEFALLPMDGWLRRPADGQANPVIDGPLKTRQDELQAWMHRIRGAILTEAFGLENDIILLLLTYELGSADFNPNAPERIERDFRYREHVSFAEKIVILKPVLDALMDKDFAHVLLSSLEECATLRNVMANYPSWIDIVNDHNHQPAGLSLCIADRNYIWNIEETDVNQWIVSFSTCRRELIVLRHQLIDSSPEDIILSVLRSSL